MGGHCVVTVQARWLIRSRSVSQPLFLRATTADVRNTQFAAVLRTSIADTHTGQGALWKRIDRVNTAVGQKH